MGKVKDVFRNYGPWEWFAAIIGLVLAIKPLIQYLIGDFDKIEGWSDTGILIVPLGGLILGCILVGAPMSTLDLFRKVAGKVTRKEKLEEQEE